MVAPFVTTYHNYELRFFYLGDKPLGKLYVKPVVGFAGRHTQWYSPSQEQVFMLSKQALQEFKEVWKKKYGEEISDAFALEQAISLLTLFGAIYRPIKKEEIAKTN